MSAIDEVMQKLQVHAEANGREIRRQREQWLEDSGILVEAGDAKEKLPDIQAAIKEGSSDFAKARILNSATLPRRDVIVHELNRVGEMLKNIALLESVPLQINSGLAALEKLRAQILTDDGWENRVVLLSRVRENFGGKNGAASNLRAYRDELEFIMEEINKKLEHDKMRFPNAEKLTIASATPTPVNRQTSSVPRLESDFDVS